MLDEQPEMQEQPARDGKLLLPGFVEDRYDIEDATPEQQVSSQERTTPHSLSTPLAPSPIPRRLWRVDPSYPVFIIALAFVIIAGITLFSFGNTLLGQLPALIGQSTPQKAPTSSTTVANLDLRPSFPTPGGGQGSQQSSLPPAYATPTWAGYPTPEPTPSPTASSGTLTIQITSNIPSQVNNHAVIPVDVMTNETGVSVTLQVTYDVAPFSYTSQAQTTDDTGNATLDWPVRVFGAQVMEATAHITAVAQDQNGQQATSQVIIVQINSFNTGT